MHTNEWSAHRIQVSMYDPQYSLKGQCTLYNVHGAAEYGVSLSKLANRKYRFSNFIPKNAQNKQDSRLCLIKCVY